MQAKAVIFDHPGGPEVLQLSTVNVPAPQANEVRIRVEAFGLNRAEVLYRHGFHPTQASFPSRIGYEAAGVIESLGTEVTGFAVGDHVGTLPVMTLNKHGAYGELMTAPAAAITHSPPALTAAESAALWTSYMTAYGGLTDFVSLAPGDFVLITAASSNSALAAIQIVKMLGATPIAVTRSQAKKGVLQEFGANHIVVSDEENLVERVMQITEGKGVNLVFDPVGGPAAEFFVELAAPYCAVVLYGVLNTDPTPFPLMAALQKNVSFHAYAMYLWDKPERDQQAITFIRNGVAKGLLRPLVGRQFTLEQITEAAQYMDSMEQVGKIVVTT